ncbi:hypothetical protein [Leptospira sp. id769339]|uniref:hypothetical protein n=1 Tax=Leptospira sp. id769339 TaxID=2864221 RepID=UPI00214C7003|nr:hypothetical protein [Leptospira sp. id769339]MCR1795869.1 hypothetical protein [Leptospira sp. id769339]
MRHIEKIFIISKLVRILILSAFFSASCFPMSKTIGYIELSETKPFNQQADVKEFKYCGRYPTIIGDSLEELKKSTGKTRIENLEIMYSNKFLPPCVLIYYVEKEKRLID